MEDFMAAISGADFSSFRFEIVELKKRYDDAERSLLKTRIKVQALQTEWASLSDEFGGKMSSDMLKTFEKGFKQKMDKMRLRDQQCEELSNALIVQMTYYRINGGDIQALGQALDVSPLLLGLTQGADDFMFATILVSTTRSKMPSNILSNDCSESSEDTSEGSSDSDLNASISDF